MPEMSSQGHQRYRINPATDPTGARPGPPRRTRKARVFAACALYAAILAAIAGGIRASPAEFWPPHLLLYGPRWILLLPAFVLLPLACWSRSWRAALALGGVAILLVGICGVNVPWRGMAIDGGSAASTLRVLTCNVQRSDLRPEVLAELVRSSQPDVILLQESSPGAARAVVGAEGWQIRSEGEFCLASRFPIEDFEALRQPDTPDRIIAVRAKVIRSGVAIPVVGIHLMTPRSGLESLIHSPLRGIDEFRRVAEVQRFESGLLRRWIDDDQGPLILAGDFNLTAEHPLYRRDWSGFTDAFARTGWGTGHTMFTRRIGLRIDHVLCTRHWRPTLSSIGPDVGSAHRPVVVDLERIDP